MLCGEEIMFDVFDIFLIYFDKLFQESPGTPVGGLLVG